MKVWITKYALTEGIIEAEAEQTQVSEKLITCKKEGWFEGALFPHFYGEGKEWHRSPEEARAYANLMVRRKIESLDKQRAKLQKLVF